MRSVPKNLNKAQKIDLERYAVEIAATDSLTPSPENEVIYGVISLETDPALSDLVESIRARGLEEPIVVTRDRFILSGHRRFEACRIIGMTHVPVRICDMTRKGCPDYDRHLIEFNPQRIKSVSSMLAEKLINETPHETYAAIQNRRLEGIWAGEPDYMSITGVKAVDPVGPKMQEFLAAVVRIVDDLKAFWPLSVRQIHYKLLNAPPLRLTPRSSRFALEKYRYQNDLASYTALDRLLASARYHGNVPMNAIDDPTRPSWLPKPFDGVRDFLEQELADFLKGYWRNLHAGQPYFVGVLAEKNTLLNIVAPVCKELAIPYWITRGYASIPLRRDVEAAFEESGKSEARMVIVSDHDPEGLNLADDVVKSLRDLHEMPVQAVRVALTMEQIEELNLQSNFAKETSTRFKGYVERTGTDRCWEVEALDPHYLQGALREGITSLLDQEIFELAKSTEGREVVEISKIRNRLGQLLRDGLLEVGGEPTGGTT